EQMRSAGRTEAPVRGVAAVGDQAVVAQLTAHRQRRAREAGVHGGAAGAEVLADAAPAGAGDHGRGADRIADRPAQAATGNFHRLPPRLLGRECSQRRAWRKGVHRSDASSNPNVLTNVPALKSWAAREPLQA